MAAFKRRTPNFILSRFWVIVCMLMNLKQRNQKLIKIKKIGCNNITRFVERARKL